MSSVELLKYSAASEDLDSPDAVDDHAMNGELAADGHDGGLKLVYLKKDGSGPPELSVHYSHSVSVASDNGASDESTKDLLQEVRSIQWWWSHAHYELMGVAHLSTITMCKCKDSVTCIE